MDYEKKYKEALQKIRELIEKGKENGWTIITYEKDFEEIFPELKESEDEKIRKELIKFVKVNIPNEERYIDWLEKQKLTKNINKEDEEVRQYLIRTMKQNDINVPMVQKALAWLEKQNSNVDNANKEYWRGYREGKQEILDKYAELEKQGKPVEINPTEFDTRLQALIGKFDSLPKEELIGSLSFWLNVVQNDGTYKPAKKQDEQTPIQDYNSIDPHFCKPVEHKPADKVEPKFNVGNWVVHDMSDGRKVIRQIVNMTNKSYVLDGEDFNTFYFNDLENDYHLWTINDAKPGDILAIEPIDDYQYPFVAIYKERGLDYFNSYCFIGFSGIFYGGECGHRTNVHPATKEQRDLLFQKMKEDGYEWDSEKKELKKIENRPILSDFFNAEYERGKADAISEIQKDWTEDDKNHMSNILNILLMEAKNAKVEQYRSSVESDIDWIYSLKNKVRVQPKQEWSKWDELQYKAAYNLCENSGHTVTSDWLKSIKQRIGG